MLRKFNTKNAHFINIRNTWSLLVNNKIHCLIQKKSKFYYDILISKKATKSHMENKWEHEFDASLKWNEIYINQVWKIVDKKLAEFIYKLISNIICTRSLIAKWNPNINTQCRHCGQRQTIKHLLYACDRVNAIWQLLGSILNLNIRYKHLIIGNKVVSDFIKSRNLLISYVAYSIYKYWIMSENGKVNFIHGNLLHFIKTDLFKRTYYVKNEEFIKLCDSVIQKI